MSVNDITTAAGSVPLSEAEKSRRKEEKRLRKEERRRAKAAVGSSSTTTPANVESTDVNPPGVLADTGAKPSEKAKKEKRKRDGEPASSVMVAGSGVVTGAVEGEKRKKKKVKTSDVDAVPPSSTTAVEASPISKKQQKKNARAAAITSASANEPTPSSSTKLPLAASSDRPVFSKEQNDYLHSNSITLTPPSFPPHLDISSLPVRPAILDFLTEKFTDPTPIQACSWPPLLAGRDVVGIAETGSGKTLAFGVPGLHHLASSSLIPTGQKGSGKGVEAGRGKSGKGQVKVLVIAPTRELAQQSHETLEALGKTLGLRSVCVFGGVGKDEQLALLAKKEVRIVVGTPGRMLDLADSGALDLSIVSYLVLDEADRMLDQGFENDIRRIIAHCPDRDSRQTVMFSATWPESVRQLASTFLRDPVRIMVGSEELSANKRIEQVVEVIEPFQKDKRMLYHLRTFLKTNINTRILVFALYKKEAQRLESTVKREGYAVGALHGDMDQVARFKALDRFKSGQMNVLVATDVAARGLDIPDVGLVLNVTFPLTTEDFVHRCGRTGRAGKKGKAVTFFTGENHERSLAGEFMRVLRDAGAEIPAEMDRFPSTIKKKEHGSYGAFFKDTTNAPAPTKIKFD